MFHVNIGIMNNDRYVFKTLNRPYENCVSVTAWFYCNIFMTS